MEPSFFELFEAEFPFPVASELWLAVRAKDALISQALVETAGVFEFEEVVPEALNSVALESIESVESDESTESPNRV